MTDYFKYSQKTAEIFYKGLLLSGDVGLINANGSVNIIDKTKKNFILGKTSENILHQKSLRMSISNQDGSIKFGSMEILSVILYLLSL